MIPQQRVNVHDIRKTFELFFVPGACVELRVPNAGRQKTISGYFDDPERLTQAAAKLSGQVAGVYLTANPANPALLARANNKAVPYPKQTTADGDIISRRWLLLDFDPVRPSGISSTDAEREAAFELARKVQDFLHGAGWPEPVLADSGNGTHLLYRIELPNDERATNIVRSCINALAARFGNEKVSIDQTVYNAARIWKLYGTMSCKGDNTADRPHRLARLLQVPDPVEVVPEELLLELAAMCPRPQEPKPDKSTSTRNFDLARWIKEHNLPVRREKAWPGGGRVWVLNPCPFNPEHTDNSAYIVQFASGAIAAGCHHNSCQGKGWHDLRDVVEPGWREKARRQGEAEGQEKAAASERKKQKAKKEDDRKARQTSFFIIERTLFEQIYVGGKSLFLALDTATGETKTVPFIELGEEIIEPIGGEDVELGAVKLPSDIAEYGDTLTLLTEIERHIHRYLDVSPNYLKFASYYVLLSWLYDRFHTIPYLRALGDTGCGKSRFLDVIGGLCYKPVFASGCVTPAPIYRMLRKWQGTLVLDEADMKNSDEYNEVVTILNCGFERGRPVIRAMKDNPDKVQILPVYGPKVFATRRRFKDVALEARCLTEIMRETDRDDIPPVLGRKFFEEQQELRNKLLLFRLRNYFTVKPEAAANLNLDGIEPRLRQISEAFVSMFANEPAVLSSYKKFILNHQRELIEQRAATKTGQVVEALFELLGNNKVTTVTLVTSVTGDSFLDVTAKDIAEKVGLTAQAVGQILKGLGLETKLVKIDGVTKRRILYKPAIFDKLRRRYILDEQKPESTVTDVTVVTNVTVTGENDSDDDKGHVEPVWEGDPDDLPF
jgi:hypothetical protein